MLKYYELNGFFPRTLSDIDPALEDHRSPHYGGWDYSPKSNCYALIKHLDDAGRDVQVFFQFYPEYKETSGWYLRTEIARRTKLKESGLSEDEERFFERQEKKGTITIHPK